jgi:hypothetical protein
MSLKSREMCIYDCPSHKMNGKNDFRSHDVYTIYFNFGFQ